MSSQTLTGISGQRQNRLTVAAVAAAIIGVAVTLVVAMVIAFGPTPARVDSPYVLGPMDDYSFRHAPAPKALGPMDDWIFVTLRLPRGSGRRRTMGPAIAHDQAAVSAGSPPIAGIRRCDGRSGRWNLSPARLYR